MLEKQIDLRFLEAKNDLIKFINEMPKKYNLSFIFIDVILNDIKAQVEKSAINDYNVLSSIYKNSQKDAILSAFNDAGVSFSDDVEVEVKNEEEEKDEK